MNKVKRIGIVVHSFPPDSGIGAQRWAKFSDSLVKRGYEIVVFTRVNQDWLVPYKMPANSGSPPEVDEVVRIPWPVTTRLLFFAMYIIAAGYKLPLWLFKRFGGKVISKMADGVERKLDVKRKAILLDLFFPDLTWKWGLRASKSIGRWFASGNRVDLLIASYPSLGNFRAASLAAESQGIPWVADIRDPISSEVLYPKKYTHRVRPFEKKLLDSATAVWTINGRLASLLNTNHKVEVLPQSFRPDPDLSARTSSDTFNIVYTGTVQSRSLYRFFFDALEECSDDAQARLIFDYYGASFNTINHYSPTASVKGIQFNNHGLVSAKECQSATSQAAVNLVFGWDGPDYECVLTGKVFDYLAAGRPIVAVAHPDSALADLIRITGSGIVLSSVSEVSKFLDSVKRDPGAVLADLENLRQQHEVDRYTTPKVADVLENLLSKALMLPSENRREELS
jgi:glycosyltransferase involved in cell wall biosynthesis